ncbi:MAG TPA: tetratricopeptide repeat protein [Xanthobacteraceae bacterium]|nr:tetratricopeptide repeat protein [Xanthobacteraceae bacterium]
MSDIFREIDEEVRREQFMKLWERYGTWMIAACVVLVLAVAGWRVYEWRQAEKAAEAGAKFEAAALLANEGKTKEAEEAFARIAADGTASYRMLAKFREAGEQARQDPKAAVAAYDQLAADGNIGRVFQDLATLRAGTLLVDTAAYADLKQRLEPLTAPDRAFRHSARVMLALSAWRAKDTAAVRQWSDMILADAETPPGARGQAQMLLALTDSDKKG